MRILIVDDEIDLVRVLELRLTQLGHQVLGVHRAAEAIARLSAFNPEYILLDLMLWDINGIELIATFRESGCICPIVLMSGNLPRNVASQMAGLGQISLLNKPFSIDELLASIADASVSLPTGPEEVRR